MFSGALQRVLVYGDQKAAPLLTFQDVADLTWETMERVHGDEAVRPFCYAPDQTEGDLSKLPAFRNPARQSLNEELSEIIRDLISAKGIADLQRLEKRIDLYIRKNPDDIDGTLIRERILSALNYEKQHWAHPRASPVQTQVLALQFISWLVRPRSAILLALLVRSPLSLFGRPAATCDATSCPLFVESARPNEGR
jgi:hypothetical protein